MPFPDFTPTIAELARRQAISHGDRELIVLGDERLTYAEAERRSRKMAIGMLAEGLGKGSRVGLLMSNGPDWVVAWLAASRIGATIVPLNTFYKARELGWVLRHADVTELLTVPGFLGHDYLSRLEEFAPELSGATGPLAILSLPYLRRVRAWTTGSLPTWAEEGPNSLTQKGEEAGQAGEDLLGEVESELSPADQAVIIYSSGSTADPKGAIHTHGTVVRHAYNLNSFRELFPDDRVYSPMPFFWVGGLVFVLLSAMHAGACVLVEDRFEAGDTLDYIEREKATIVAGWPHYGKAMAEHESFAGRDLSSIRMGNIYAVLPEELQPADPELRATSLGMTETAGPHTIEDMTVDLPEKLRGSFGKSVPGLEHKIIDPETGLTLGPDESGEILARGYSLMQGLYKVEREQSFDEEGFYHTGDGGRFNDEGHLFFEGRLGDVIKTGGANVSPREIEVLMEAQDEIKEAYVVGLPHPDRGETVTAVAVLVAGQDLSEDELRERLKRELSSYKVPTRILYVTSAELPMTDTGKIDKKRLKTQLEKAL
jgi:acyl-CoA synthetase (AMP-forming)/AMP-acid ligase II